MGRWMLRKRVKRGEETDCSLLHQPEVLEDCQLGAVGEGRGCCSRTSLCPSETSCLLVEVAGWVVGFVQQMVVV